MEQDDNMFLRHIKEQVRENQKANLLNSFLMNSLNRPADAGPWKTQIAQGDPGKFASPMPLGTNNTTIPKTTMPMPQPPMMGASPTPAMPQPQMPGSVNPQPQFGMPQKPDPRLENSPYSIPNLLKSIMGMGAPRQ